jgi:hypothetical protein
LRGAYNSEAKLEALRGKEELVWVVLENALEMLEVEKSQWEN